MKDGHEPSSTMMKGCCVKLYWGGGVAAEIDLVLVLSIRCCTYILKRISTAQLPQCLFRFAIRVVPFLFLLLGLSAIAPNSPACSPVAHSLAVLRSLGCTTQA